MQVQFMNDFINGHVPLEEDAPESHEEGGGASGGSDDSRGRK